MKFAILSVAAAAALTLSAGSASAQWGHHHGHRHGNGHLDYHNGHYHYHDGFYRSGPLYPVYPSYGYGYSPGVSLQPGILSPSWGYNNYNSPYAGRSNYGSYRWR
jgi:hypothetical protein